MIKQSSAVAMPPPQAHSARLPSRTCSQNANGNTRAKGNKDRHLPRSARPFHTGVLGFQVDAGSSSANS